MHMEGVLQTMEVPLCMYSCGVKGHLESTNWLKDQSVDVACGAQQHLFCIFEYITTGPCWAVKC